ncbi:MAG TPA: glycosyltransferase family 4 protein [Gaiellaceae bacterium]|nr:glycosyltransferase family 4 protein [Gaiellaceae bacterium]
MKVAYFSPMPPERTGIADYSGLLVPALRERVDLDIVRRGTRRLPRGTDVALYHVGNNPDAHGWIVGALRRNRGIVVLHDFVLHHLVAGLTFARGDKEGYLDAMQRDAGTVGRLIAHGVADGLLPPVWESRPQEFPLVHSVLDHADGVIVHSRYVEDEVRARGYPGPIWRIPMPTWPAPDVEPLRLPRDASVVIGCFGNLNPAKRLPQLLRAFAEVRRGHPEALLVIAGGISSRHELDLHVTESGLQLDESVIHLGYVEEDDIWPLLAACDVLVSLRFPTMGETSGSVIRTLAVGRPLVVSDVGWFSELPDSVAAKVPVDESEVDTLSAFLELLVSDPVLRARMGNAARELAVREHGLDHVVDRYVAALEEAAGRDAVRNALRSDLARAGVELGLDARSRELDELVASMRELDL